MTIMRTITRTRNGSGTTVTVGDRPPLCHLPCRPSDDADDEDADCICDRGSVIPSALWAGNFRADLPDADALQDVNDMLTDFDIEEPGAGDRE